jgi:3-methylcrotonyl-CoA carboxylase alpha subunit
LLEGDRFFFLEVNTRLQVEHPITEMIAGQDLVEWQLRIASGERLPLAQGELTTRGCAMEARICAEDPPQGFLPSVGQIKHLRFPKQDIAVRIDTGVSQGDRITQYYDSLIAKLIVWGESRHAALRRLRKKLSEFELVGVETNLDVLRAIASDHQFVSGEIDTNFVESNADRLLLRATISGSDESVILAAASVSRLQELRREQQGRSEETEFKLSPWSLGDAWRIDGSSAHHDLTFDFEGRKLTTRITPLADGFRMEALSASLMIDAVQIDGRVSLRAGDIKREVGVVRDGAALVIVIDGRNYPLVPVDSLQPARSETGSQVKMNAPIPARVTALFASPGEKVKTGAPLVVLEAMKMEITLRAPRDAVIADVRCSVGEMASEGSELVVFAEDDRS